MRISHACIRYGSCDELLEVTLTIPGYGLAYMEATGDDSGVIRVGIIFVYKNEYCWIGKFDNIVHSNSNISNVSEMQTASRNVRESVTSSAVTNSEILGSLILVVDDYQALRKTVIRQLNTLGFCNILEAQDGVEALTIVHENPVDLILLDIDMPGADGLEVLAILKANERTVSLPVIVISGSEESSKTSDCIELGAEDYLRKPFDSVLLRARVLSSLEKKRLRDLDQHHLEILNREKLLLEIEQLKTEKLMLSILPRPIAERLKRGEKNISGSYSDVTILFSDLVGFTEMTSKMTAVGLVELLNDIFTRFDVRADTLGLEKIKTMGDSYMAAGGLPIPRPDHAEICAEMAIGMLNDLENFNHETGSDLSMRIGMSSGPVVAGVIGHNKFSYDLWGNTVNTASRMESTSHNNCVQVSSTTYESLKDTYTFQYGGLVECKGLGKISTYFLLGKKSSE